ncbi:MAG: hypothetical protein HRU20_16840 [Pseudomonadales bacterium]|nr:hypothetical protein [Pseudomonadales bacterium]
MYEHHHPTSPFPGAIGGQIGGQFLLSKALPCGVEYTVSLSCNYNAITGSSDNRRCSESIKWHIQELAKPQPLTTKQTHSDRLSFAFDIPDHLPPTQSHLKQPAYHLWRCYINQIYQNNSLDWMDIVFNGIALLPASIALISFITFITLFLNSLTVRFDQHGVHSMRKIVGICVAKRFACYDEIQYLKVERNGSTGSGHNKVEHFHITAITKKKDFPVATSIDGRAAAEILKEHLETLMISRLS